MASGRAGGLSRAWDDYVDCKARGADLQVSLQCLERFLCLFHCVRHADHLHKKDDVKFCSDMSGASNTLAREFLTDVHQLCSAVAQRAEEDEDSQSHMVALAEYLVRGRGFLLLSTLNCVIDQELTCREELLALLLSLLPLVWRIPVQEEKAPDFTLPALLDIFSSRERAAGPPRTGQENVGPDASGSGKHPTAGIKPRRQRRAAQRYSVRDACKSQLSTSDSDANSDDRTVGSARRRRRSQVPSHPPPPIADSMTAVDRAESQQRLLGEETLTDPAALSIFNRMENSAFDLCHVLLSLLEKVCKFDMSLNHNPALAASVVPTLTEILTDFGDCCGPGGGGGGGGLAEDLASGWTEEPIALVQRMLLRTILHLMSVDLSKAEALPDRLRRSLTGLLRATVKIRGCLEKQADPFAPRPKRTLEEMQEEFSSFSRCRHRALLLPELLEGVLQVLLGCLQASTPNPFFFSQAVELVHEFVQHRGLELFETTVLQLEALGGQAEEGETAGRVRRLISSMVRIVSTIKRTKSEQLHQSVCARRRHRRCEYSHFLHHHRDLSGLPVSAFKQEAHRNPFDEDPGDGEVRYPDRCCCLAACAHQCLRLLGRLPSSGAASLQVLVAVQAVGVCCCMDPRSVVTPLLHAFRTPELRSHQAHILAVLARLLLEQLGGGQPSQRARLASCNICMVDSSQVPGIEDPTSDSALSSLSPAYRSQGILPSGSAEDVLWKWEALEAYRELAFGEDRQQSLLVAGHVCQLLLQGNVAVQWQLYANVLGPVLQRAVDVARHARELGVTIGCTQACGYHSRCLSVEVLLVYLQTLPVLLKSRVIRDLFLSCNGLNQVTELISLDPTRSWALKVLETLILSVREQQADGLREMQESGDPGGLEAVPEKIMGRGPQAGAGEGPSSLSRVYEGLREPFAPRRRTRDGVHLAAVNLLLCVAFLCVSKEADSDRDSANDSEDTSGYDSTASEPAGRRLPCLSPDSVTLPSREQMRRAADVWSACRWVFMSSPLFQRQFCRLGGLEACHRLLALVIQKLAPKDKDSRAIKKQKSKSQAALSLLDTQALISVQSRPQGSTGVTSAAQEEPRVRDPDRQLDEDFSLHSIRLLEALLAICLHSAGLSLQHTEAELSFQTVEETLAEVRDQLLRSGVVESDLAVPLLDSLLRVAQFQARDRLAVPEEKGERKHQTGAEAAPPTGYVSEDTEEPPGCETLPPGEEEGYDADSESNPEDTSSREEVAGVELSGLRDDGLGTETAARQGVLFFPEVCAMELVLLSTGSPDRDVLRHVLQSLLGAVRSHPRNAALLYQQDAVKTILSGFQSILNQSDASIEECQALLLELLVAMVSERITGEELAMLIRLFLEKSPPTEILLRGVLRLVEANMDMEPLHFLSFPLESSSSPPVTASPGPKPAGGVAGVGAKAVGLLWRGKPAPVRREVDAETRLGHQLASPWHVAPIHLPLVGQNCWPHMANGFSTSLWLRPRTRTAEQRGVRRRPGAPWDNTVDSTEEEISVRSPRVDHQGGARCLDRLVEQGCLHIVSLGSKALMLQVWANLTSGVFTFRICMDPNDEMRAGLLAQAESGEGLLVPDRWQHLAITYTQQPEGKKSIHGTLTLWVCGTRRCEVLLDYTLPRKPSLAADSNKTFCMLGHCLESTEDFARLGGGWDVGSLLLFNGSRIGPEEAFYLYASGPDFTSIMPCKYGKRRGPLSRYVTREALQCERVQQLLMRNQDLDTAPLIESLAVVYAPSCPGQYTIYEPVIRLKGQARTVVSQRPFSTKEVQSSALDAQTLAALQPAEPHGLQSVLHKIGGTGAFVFLFARAVELSSCEKTQALALQVLLSLVKYNQHRVHEMESCHGYAMVHQVLIKSKCIVGYHMLKTLLDGCCSGPILTLGEDDQFRLDTESHAIVQDLTLMSEVLLDWKIWAKAQCGVWETLLVALEILIRVHHPQQVFNIRQLLNAQVVHRFLLTCQVLQEHRDEHLTSIPQDVCLSFVKIIQEVLGSPPDLELLRLISNFLLAVHPPTNTYVCHTPSSFYFALHVDGKLYQEKVQSIIYLRHSGSSKSAGSSVHSLSPTPFAEVPPEELVPSSEQDGEVQALRPPSLATSPRSSPPPGERDGAIQGAQQVLSSTETVRRSIGDESVLSSCESARTLCDPREPPAIDVEAEPTENDEALRRPDSLRGIQSFQRSQSNLASLGLAFPAQNGSLTVGRWPSMGDRGLLPDDWESYTFSPGYERGYGKADSTQDRTSAEDCLVLVCCGLYELLRGVLLLLPDLMLEEVMDKVVQPEALIVLVNHPSPLIQQGVMKLLDAYFSRAAKEQKEKFLKNHGFSLLANQLYLHQGSQGLLECFLEMLFGRPVGLDEDLDVEDLENIPPFRRRCVIPILGLIENGLCENALVHNALCVLLQLLNACPKMTDILLDQGLLYVLFNTLATLHGLENGMPQNDYKLLVCDIQQLLVAVTIHSCCTSGSQYFRIIEDLITLLGYLQTSRIRRTQDMAVALQFRILQAAIEFIKTTANQDPQKPGGPLHVPTSPPSSPHHALHQKRKSIAGCTAMKDSIIPSIPRQHYCSYGQVPLSPPFSFLSQGSPLPSPTGSTSYVFPTDAGRRRFSLAQSDSLLMRMRSVASDELTQMMQRRMSQENPIRASESEFIQRLQRLLVLAVNRLIYQDVGQDFFDLLNIPESPAHQGVSAGAGEHGPEENGAVPPPATRKSFQKEILKLMTEGIKIGLGSSGRSSVPRQMWRRILWSCRDTFRVQIGRLLVHTLSTMRPIADRREALEFVYDPVHPDILRESLSPSLEHGPKLALYLYELLHDHRHSLTKEEQTAVGVFMTALKLCGHRCIPPNAPPRPDLIKAIKEEQLKYESEENTSKGAWEKKMNNTQKSLMQRLEAKSKDISKIAADITQNVSLRQGMERKKVMQHIRGLYKVDLTASRHWQELVQQLTHDRAVWYDQASYPTSWQLDPTEGPNRERRRLQRCYLTIPNKYLLKDRQKPEDPVKPPLSFLFEDKTHSSFSSTVKDKATSEAIRFTRRCISVAPSRETAGELLLGKSGMYFVEDNASDAHDNQSPHGETEPASFSWTYEEIKEVHKRWWQLRDNAVEIFLTNGRTLLLAFDNTKFRDDVYHNILTSNLPNLLEYGNITALTNLWSSGQISNFEYLTHLNKHAGRSFNDLMQYPVFPFILSDYTSETLDLNDPAVYRNLSKPIAVQSKEKEERYVDNYRYLEEEFRKGAREDDPMPPVQPYHYGSHYSNSGTVLHFLVRMPPFTKMFLAYQDQSFDIPDRTFHSMNTTWRLSSYESMTDVKELIPEFFYLPEFLVNREGFDFGVRQNGDRVNHVNLPSWARSDPRLFVLIYRQALESDQVSQTLCQWIDLVFGLKQKGKAAVQAINVFHPATYFGMDVSAVEDPVQRRALETMIKTYGQTPRQLFSTSHVSRAGPRLLMEGELPSAVGLLVQLAFRDTREHPREVTCPSPLPWIKGLKWGEYVGSPSAPDPVVCFSQPHGEAFGSLLALPTRAICGLSRKFCLMMIYSKEQGVRSMHSTDIQWSAILSWGYADNMLRLKSKQSEPPINFIQCSQLHQVTSCAWVPDSCQLFTGSKCGIITAYSNRFTSTMPSEMEVESQVHLYGHTAEVRCLFVCKPYSILISASNDGTCIIWDLNRLCHVQNLTGHKSPVTAVSASETTGDIATVCDSVGGGSDLRLWTVNGDLVGHVHCRETICSVAFSNQPEGLSVNVIAGGLENGVVRLWSTWDLKPVREITFPKSSRPIVSLTYSCDGHHLYTANSEGTVMGWCRRDQQRMKLPMFYSFLSSYAAG
ncbi:lysosomal-trafficking regulator isoform X1 [Scleropages formosus]|uniref:lysosomal-trafficking regulator isoform X1 n=2 Tax=Scleropages formosus TaxID=113540 RepID=UPI0010FA727D|nr:lysosomal-trafficking regulator-like isoform X1 [Scleropages formosus]XP_029107090.1 lysosomal-trafficking regulator-like isoform X1 [Scleropages formosus]